MQISTPTQALDSPSGGAPPQESGFFGSVHSDSSGFWHGKAQKKDKLGIFAKLLDGLAVKNTKGKEKAENNAEALKLKKPGENAGKSGEKAVNAAKVGEAAVKSARFDPKPENNNQTARHNAKTTPGSELLNNGAFHGELSAFSGFGFNPNESKTTIPFIKEDPGGNKGKEVSFTGNESQKAAKLLNGNVSKSLNGSPGGNPAGLPAGLPAEKEALKGFGNSTGDVNKSGKETSNKQTPSGMQSLKNTGRGAAVSFSLKDMENQYLQSQGITGPVSSDPKLKFTSSGEAGDKEIKGSSDSRGKKGKFSIDVRDLRTQAERNQAGEAVNSGPAKETASAKQPLTEIELPVDLENRAGKGNGDLSWTGGKGLSSGGGFEDALARELQGNLSQDIVRDASVIVRNGGEGTIRLSLHPASLGNVKIRLEMTENKITGHIVVESNEALRAFERELPVLEKAFKDSGFSETNLEMSLTQDGTNSGGREQRRDRELDALAPVLAASSYGNRTEWIDASGETLPNQGEMVLPRNGAESPAGRIPVNLLI